MRDLLSLKFMFFDLRVSSKIFILYPRCYHLSIDFYRLSIIFLRNQRGVSKMASYVKLNSKARCDFVLGNAAELEMQLCKLKTSYL